MDPDFRKASCSSSNVIRVFWIGGNDVCSVAAAPSSALLRFRRRDDPARRPPRMVSVARGESSWSSMSVLQFTTPPVNYLYCLRFLIGDLWLPSVPVEQHTGVEGRFLPGEKIGSSSVILYWYCKVHSS